MSLRSPPSGIDDGEPPPEQTLEASPIIFSSRRVCRIPVCRRDRSCLKFWVEVAAQTFKSISPARESDRRCRWCPLGWRSAVTGAGRRRTEGRPLHRGPIYIYVSYIHICIYTVRIRGRRPHALKGHWVGGAPSSEPYGGERRDVRTLKAVRTSSLDPLRVCIYIYLNRLRNRKWNNVSST